MSRASDGTYTAPSNSVNPAVEGTEIDENDFNELIDDMVAALTDSLSVSGKGAVTAHIEFDEASDPSTPAADKMRLYVKDMGGTSALMVMDENGNTYNLLLAASGLAFTFDTSTTTSADPGSGEIRFNNATVASVTEIAVDDNEANGSDVSPYLLTWDDESGSNRGTLIIQKRTDPSIFAIFTISGASTDESGWVRLAVTHVASSGTWAAGDPLGVTFLKSGAAGATGATGATGAAGADGANGADGADGADPGLLYTFSTTVTDADPGDGYVRANNADLSSATELYVDDVDRSSNNHETALLSWDDVSNAAARGELTLTRTSDGAQAYFQITGGSTDASGYVKLSVTYVSGVTSFSNDDPVSLQFARAGADGAGTGDVSGPASSVDNEIALFDSTTGKLIKRATTTGLLKAASGVIAAAVADTDYSDPSTLASTSNGEGASLIGIEDSGALITATTVEGALAENRTAIDAIEADYLQAADIANMLETSDIGVTVQGYDADTLKADTADVLTAGFAATPHDEGTKSSGTFTPDEADGNLQYAVNGGAHTLGPPTNNCTMVVQYTNNGSAGPITTSGFTVVDGDTPTTVNGDDFFAFIVKNNGFSSLTWKALQ